MNAPAAGRGSNQKGTTMRIYSLAGVAALGLATLLSGTQGGRAREPESNQPAPEEGVEVLTRGPVHEAFAEPTIRNPAPAPVVPKRPPGAIEELPPDKTVEGALWVPGYWDWDDDRSDFVWVSGVWRVPPPDRQWTPGYWTASDAGWQRVPGFWAAQNQSSIELLPPPPEPAAESPAPAPADNSFFVPGCWMWRETRYLWRAGYWQRYQPGWVWNSSHYVWAPGGCVYQEGYWDYPLGNRGLLFAPVAFDRRVRERRGWAYQPSLVVPDQFLLGSLFVGRNANSYYFGDYFDPKYERRGMVPWVDFRIGRHAYDPLYTYYRWHHRDEPRWDRDLRDLYAGRARGDVARPPQTLVQQNQLIQRIENNTTSTTNIDINVRNVTAVTTLNNVSRTMRLQNLTENQRTDLRQTAVRYQALSSERSRLDARLLGSGRAPATTDRPETFRLEGARPTYAAGTTTPVRRPPAAPSQPRPEVRRQEEPRRPGATPARVENPAAPRERPERVGAVAPRERPIQGATERPQARPPARTPERPDPRTPMRTPERPGAVPSARPLESPPLRPAERPEARPPARPGERPETRPAAQPTGRPDVRPVPNQKPPVRSPDRPETRPASGSTERPVPQPQVRPTERTEARPPAPRVEPRPEARPPLERPQPRPEARPASTRPAAEPSRAQAQNEKPAAHAEEPPRPRPRERPAVHPVQPPRPPAHEAPAPRAAPEPHRAPDPPPNKPHPDNHK